MSAFSPLAKRLFAAWFDRRVTRLATKPGSIHLTVWLARRLIRSARFAEAEAVLDRAVERHPHAADLAEVHALCANDGGQYAIALARWDRLRGLAPGRPMAWCGLAANARALNDLAGARATIREALEHFPDDPLILSEAARVADRRGAPHEALPYWQRLAARRDAHPTWCRGFAHALLLVGRHDEAASALDEAERRFPDDASLLATRGILAMNRRDWDEAKRIWRLYQVRFPDDLIGWDGFGRTLAAAGLDDTIPPPAKAEVGFCEDEETRALLLRFEGIGRDCEFGLLQRRFGAEPISLLRWNTLPPERLIEALAARFEGMGDPDLTEVFVDTHGQYLVRDRRWGLTLYTFLYKSDSVDPTLPGRMSRRLAFLRDKFLTDITATEKTFVLTQAHVDLDLMRRLHTALGGPNHGRLLVVTTGKSGEVVEREPGLFVGTISHLGMVEGQWRLAIDDWLRVLRAVDGTVSRSRHPSAA